MTTNIHNEADETKFDTYKKPKITGEDISTKAGAGFLVLVGALIIAIVLAVVFIRVAIWLAVAVLASFAVATLLYVFMIKKKNRQLQKANETKPTVGDSSDYR